MVKKPASEIKLEDAEATVSCTVDVIKDVIDGKSNAMEAMGENKFKIEGSMAALMKLGPAIM
jgi:putative sterol carrier protein